jgi:acetyl esterase/lipase
MTAKEYEVAIRPDIVFVEHDDVKLLGDLYLPQGRSEAPVLVGVHGGGWQLGDRKFYRHWGRYLAKHGYAVFAIDYRLMKPGVKTWRAWCTIARRRCSSCEPTQKSSASIPTVSG